MPPTKKYPVQLFHLTEGERYSIQTIMDISQVHETTVRRWADEGYLLRGRADGRTTFRINPKKQPEYKVQLPGQVHTNTVPVVKRKNSDETLEELYQDILAGRQTAPPMDIVKFLKQNPDVERLEQCRAALEQFHEIVSYVIERS